MSSLNELAELIAKRVVEQYGIKISIIAIYGSIATGKQSDYSDLDMYAITSLENQMKWSFIFQDKAVDIWSMDWEEAEEIASAKKDKLKIWCVAAHIFVNCKVLYYRNEQDLERFNSLKKSIQKIKEDTEGNFMRAMSQFNMDYSIERVKLAKVKNDILTARWALWGLINNICATLSWLNNVYYSKN